MDPTFKLSLFRAALRKLMKNKKSKRRSSGESSGLGSSLSVYSDLGSAEDLSWVYPEDLLCPGEHLNGLQLQPPDARLYR